MWPEPTHAGRMSYRFKRLRRLSDIEQEENEGEEAEENEGEETEENEGEEDDDTLGGFIVNDENDGGSDTEEESEGEEDTDADAEDASVGEEDADADAEDASGDEEDADEENYVSEDEIVMNVLMHYGDVLSVQTIHCPGRMTIVYRKTDPNSNGGMTGQYEEILLPILEKILGRRACREVLPPFFELLN